jgi:hypothetical protein
VNKFVYKLRPCDYWRIGENESWFSDMASKGFHLEKTGIHFAKFIKGEPQKKKYRIDISKPITSEQMAIFTESGWYYVTHYKEFYIYASPEEKNAPELHTDSVEQSYTLKHLDNKLLFNFVFTAIATIITMGFLYAVLRRGNITLSLIEGNFIQQLIVTLLMIYIVYSSFQAARSIRILRRKLMLGKPINHNAPWKKYLNTKIILIIIYFTVLINFGTIIPIAQILLNEMNHLPTEDTSLPIVRLWDLEEGINELKGQSYTINDRRDISVYSYDWSIFAPIQYDATEKIHMNDHYAYITTKFYQLRFPSMSESLLQDLINKYGIKDINSKSIALHHSKFDVLIVNEASDKIKQVFASKGKFVIYVRYHGNADLESVIENISFKMK